MKSHILLCYFLLLTLCTFVSSQVACKGSVNGVAYDLTRLASAIGNQQVTCVDDKENTYYYLPCAVVPEPQCRFVYDTTPGVCQKDSRKPVNLYHGLGTVGSASFRQRSNGNPRSGFILAFPNGGEPDPPPARTTDIEFICDSGAGTGSFQPNNPAENPTHDYHLMWRSAYACPVGGGDNGNNDNGDGGDGDGGSGGISGGWVFIIILVGVIFLYLAIGCAVRKFVMGASGIDIIPNVVFWLALPGLVKDGNVYTFRKLLGLCGRGGYSQV